MTDVLAPLTGGTELLDGAIHYTLGSLRLVTPPAPSHPTPCRDWNLAALLAHLNDSLAALHEAVDFGRVELGPPAAFGGGDLEPPFGDDDPAGDLVATAWNRASRLLGASSGSVSCSGSGLDPAPRRPASSTTRTWRSRRT